MRFGMYGYMSNGNGLFDFYCYDVKKMKNVMDCPAAFEFMNFLIIRLLHECYYSNEAKNVIFLTEQCIHEFISLKSEEVRERLVYLQANNLIKFKKIEDEQVWIITYI